MDEALREQIRQLAESNGLDPAALEPLFQSGEVPDEVQEAIAAVLGDVELFDKALSGLDK